MRIDPLSLLRVLHLFDSQLPVGAFAHSGGIETYAAHGAGPKEVREILGGQIALGWGRGELAAACLAWRAAPDGADALSRVAARVHAVKVIPAIRDASVRLGQRTLTLLRRLYPDALGPIEVAPPHHAVVVGAAARRLGLPVDATLLAFAQSLATGMLTSAARCLPLSPAEAHALLAGAERALAEAAADVSDDPDAHLFTCTPALDIRAHQQAFLRTRLFQS